MIYTWQFGGTSRTVWSRMVVLSGPAPSSSLQLVCGMLSVVALLSIITSFFTLQDLSTRYIAAPRQRDEQQTDSPELQQGNWTYRRQILQRASGVKKVFLHAYMRGGSTLLYEIFNHDPRAMAWYEPLATVYEALYGMPEYQDYFKIVFEEKIKGQFNGKLRRLTQMETDAIGEFLRGVFECELERLPTECLSSNFMTNTRQLQDYLRCYMLENQHNQLWDHTCQQASGIAPYCGSHLRNITMLSDLHTATRNRCPEYLQMARSTSRDVLLLNVTEEAERNKRLAFHNYESCMQTIHNKSQICLQRTSAGDTCRNTTIRTAKILRLKMLNLDTFIEAFPDMYIVYYTRDPRATANSRVSPVPKHWMTSTIRLCEEMWPDLMEVHRLQHKYPRLILRLRYEDIVESPHSALHQLYSHISEVPGQALEDWLMATMYATSEDGVQGVRRKNATENENRWRRTYPQEAIDYVTSHPSCSELLKLLGYAHA